MIHRPAQHWGTSLFLPNLSHRSFNCRTKPSVCVESTSIPNSVFEGYTVTRPSSELERSGVENLDFTGYLNDVSNVLYM